MLQSKNDECNKHQPQEIFVGNQRSYVALVLQLPLSIRLYVLKIRDYTDPFQFFSDGIGTPKETYLIGMGVDSWGPIAFFIFFLYKTANPYILPY